MDNTWVKLYRKIADHEVITDPLACQVLLLLFTQVNKVTGEFEIGRFTAARWLNMNPSTFYKVLKRLEKKYKIVTCSSNNKITKISLLNWAKYQPIDKLVTGNSNTKVTTKEQQSNNAITNIGIIKNKEYRESVTRPLKFRIDYLLKIPLEDFSKFRKVSAATDNQIINKGGQLYDWLGSKGQRRKNYYLFLSGALRRDFPKIEIDVSPMGYRKMN